MAAADPFEALGDPQSPARSSRCWPAPSCPVAAIADQLPISRPAVSRHLRVLKDAGLVDRGRRRHPADLPPGRPGRARRSALPGAGVGRGGDAVSALRGEHHAGAGPVIEPLRLSVEVACPVEHAFASLDPPASTAGGPPTTPSAAIPPPRSCWSRISAAGSSSVRRTAPSTTGARSPAGSRRTGWATSGICVGPRGAPPEVEIRFVAVGDAAHPARDRAHRLGARSAPRRRPGGTGTERAGPPCCRTSRPAAERREENEERWPPEPRTIPGSSRTAPGTSAYTMWADEAADPPTLVLPGRVDPAASTSCGAIDDLHAWLVEQGDWVDLGAADEKKPAKDGTVEAFGRADGQPGRRLVRAAQGLSGSVRHVPATAAGGARQGRADPRPAQQQGPRALTLRSVVGRPQMPAAMEDRFCQVESRQNSAELPALARREQPQPRARSTDQANNGAHDIQHDLCRSRRHVAARCAPPRRRHHLRPVGAAGHPGGAGPGRRGPGPDQPRHAAGRRRRLDRPRPRCRRRAALRLPRARRVGPRRRCPVQPGQAAARPVRPRDHRRRRLLRPDPGPHPESNYIPDADRLLRRRAAERRGRRQPAARADRPRRRRWPRRVHLRAARQGLHPAAPGGAGAPARHVRGPGLPGRDPAPGRPRRHRGRAAAGAPASSPSRS